MIPIVSKYLLPKGFVAFAVFPFVFLKSKEFKQNVMLLHHERIHLRQQLELLIVPFFLWYVLEFLWHWSQTKSKAVAYRKICFEKEAYQNETNLDYMKQRPFFNFLSYLNNNS